MSSLGHSRIAVGDQDRHGDLCIVQGAHGLVVFVHVDGGAQTSRRSTDLARRLQLRRFNTLMFELLTPDEAGDSATRHDVELLTQRVLQAVRAVPASQRELPLGLFGAGVGAAAALVADTMLPHGAAAIVSRGGQLELAAKALSEVRAPTLLIVGAADIEVLARNRQALTHLRCDKRIEVVPRASHLFLEAGALDTVAHHAGDWFATYLQQQRT